MNKSNIQQQKIIATAVIVTALFLIAATTITTQAQAFTGTQIGMGYCLLQAPIAQPAIQQFTKVHPFTDVIMKDMSHKNNTASEKWGQELATSVVNYMTTHNISLHILGSQIKDCMNG